MQINNKGIVAVSINQAYCFITQPSWKAQGWKKEHLSYRALVDFMAKYRTF